jgi:hypothetical protein
LLRHCFFDATAAFAASNLARSAGDRSQIAWYRAAFERRCCDVNPAAGNMSKICFVVSMIAPELVKGL